MKVAIIGMGSIGSLWAYKLYQSGHNIVSFTRDTSTSALNIQLDEQPKVNFIANDVSQLESCDLIMLTVKSTQVAQAIEPLYPYINQQTPIIFLHNGMGAVDELDVKWHQCPLFLATTTQAAFKPSEHQVKHTGFGDTLIGPYPSSSQQTHKLLPLIEQLNHALPKVSWQEAIQQALWKKLVVNSVINPLTAIEQCKNGELAHQRYQQHIEHLIDECHLVMTMDGCDFPLSQLRQFVFQVIDSTAQNYSSMYQDIHHQRQTEIDFITGYIIKKAQQYGIEVTNHQDLYLQIKQLEASFANQV